MKKYFNLIFDCFFKRKGEIIFASGNHEIFVFVKIRQDEKVIFKIEEIDCTTCGYLPKNTFFVEEKNIGFKLIANIESNEVKFRWNLI